jgi:hypothetical protein
MASDPTRIELGHIADIIFGPQLKSKLKEQGFDTTRAIYELSTPTTQCGAVTKIRNPDGTLCYICGMKINQNDIEYDAKGRSVNKGLTAECEHLLSIAQAIIFLGLYWAKAPKNDLFSPDMSVLKLEYAWAHRTCNQIKSDRTFILYNNSNERFDVNFPAIQKLLNDIYTNKRSDSLNFNIILKDTYTTKKSFIDSRTPYVAYKFQLICDYLNSFNAPQLLTLIGATKVMEGQLHPDAKRILSANTIEKFNSPGIKAIINVASLLEEFDNIKLQTITLLPDSLKSISKEFIMSQGEDNPNPYIYFLYDAPEDLKQYTNAYLKIIFLRKLGKFMESIGKRSNTIYKTADFLIKSSKMSENTLEALNEYSKSLGIIVGGRKNKNNRRKSRKNKN